MPSESADRCLLPDFLVIGAMKCGTTTLYHDLRAQPGVFVGEKEPNIFLDGSVDDYRSFFARALPDQILGEVSPDYAKLPDRSAGLVQTVFDCYGGRAPKILYLVREPMERVASHHRFDVSQRGRMSDDMPEDINDAVRECPQLLDYTRYQQQLAPWIDAFGRENVLVIRFAEYVADRKEIVGRVCEFIGAEFDPAAVDPTRVWNRSDFRPVATPGWRWLLDRGLYRRLIRRFLSPAMRERLRKRLLPQAKLKKQSMSVETIDLIRREVGEEMEQLR